jgi:hypothetical protein
MLISWPILAGVAILSLIYSSGIVSAKGDLNIQESIQGKERQVTITMNGVKLTLDTTPVLYKKAMFIPLSSLIKNLDIEYKWDQANILFSLSGTELMQTDMIKGWEELDHLEGPVETNNAFMPISYTWTLNPGIIDGKKEILQYIIVKGRILR